MRLSCPGQAELTSLRQAKEAYAGSFLTSELIRDLSGNLTKDGFTKLLEKAKADKKYIDQNAFTFQQMVDSVQREFCFVNQQYLYLLKEYLKNSTNEQKIQVQKKNQQLQDLLSVLSFFDDMTAKGGDSNMVNPTQEQKPYSAANLAPIESFQNFGNKYTELKVELQEQMKDLTADELLSLRKDMVDYSKEKNRAATNLLGVYAFLNLTAIGLLIYIFRSK